LVIKDRDRVDEHYAKLAKKEGYPARSVYKLKEIDESKKVLKASQKVLDLGCCPGSWSLYAAKKVKLVVGVDLDKPNVPAADNLQFYQLDILEGPPPDIVGLGPFQVLLSDLAPKTSGQKADDSAKSLELVQGAFSWAEALLEKGGTFLFKFFQGADFDPFLKSGIRPYFKAVNLHKPGAVRKRSVELYALCEGFKGKTKP
jgi:23S rRNA (uridine2552-2'-O)-methyltransferase